MNMYKKFRAVALILLSAVVASAIYLFLHAKDDLYGNFTYRHAKQKVEYRGEFGTAGRTDVVGEALGLERAYQHECCKTSLETADETLAWYEDSSDQALAVNDLKVEAVPEPETYAMLLAGLGALGAIARRRKSGD